MTGAAQISNARSTGRWFLMAAISALASGVGSLAFQSGGLPLQPVQGIVVDDQTSTPLRRVRIQVIAPGLTADPVFTSDEGRFEALVPRSGSYSVHVRKAGFSALELRSTDLLDPTRAIRLRRGVVISGRVVDSFGDPVHTRVTVRGGPNGEIALDTDDRGEYRVGSLPEGRYQVAVRFVGATQQSPSAVRDNSDGEIRTIDARSGDEIALAHVDPFAATAAGAQLGLPLNFVGRLWSGRGGAAVRGRLTRIDGRAVGGVAVMLFRAGGRESSGDDQLRMTLTSADGTYEFAGLEAGAYRINAMKRTALLFPVQRDVTATARVGQVAEVPDIHLERPGAVSGRVTDDFGEPVEGLTVQLWEVRRGPGRSSLSPANAAPAGHTDDRGVFRVFVPGSAPGFTTAREYYAVVTDEPRYSRDTKTDAAVVTRVYFPGVATVRDAIALHVAGGRDIEGITIAFGPRATGLVRGFAFSASGQPLAGTVTLRDSVRSGFPIPAERRAAVAPDGSFAFLNVPPGDYVLQGSVPGPGRPAEFATQYVTVAEGDGPLVTLRTTSGTTLTGRIIADGDRSGLSLDEFGLSVQRTDPDQAVTGAEFAQALVAEDGVFEIDGLHGPLRISGSAPDGWWLKSVTIGTVDATYQPFVFGGTARIENAEAVFADDAAVLTGVVADGGRPSADRRVLVFSTDRDRWWAPSGYVKLARSADDGTFRTDSLPPGDYYAVAVDAFDIESEWLDPEVLARLSASARRVTVRPRQQAAVSLDLIRRVP